MCSWYTYLVEVSWRGMSIKCVFFNKIFKLIFLLVFILLNKL